MAVSVGALSWWNTVFSNLPIARSVQEDKLRIIYALGIKNKSSVVSMFHFLNEVTMAPSVTKIESRQAFFLVLYHDSQSPIKPVTLSQLTNCQSTVCKHKLSIFFNSFFGLGSRRMSLGKFVISRHIAAFIRLKYCVS